MGTKVDRLSDAESGATTGSTKSTSTGSTTGTGGRGTGRRRGTEGKTEEKAGTPRVVNVEVPGKTKEMSDEEKQVEEKRKKDRERKARSRANAKSSPRSSGKSKAPSMEMLQLKPILMTVSQMVASREGFEVWALSESEIDALCEPIQNMLAKTAALEKVGENSDAIALTIACFTIFIPKFLAWNATRKIKKAQVVTNYAKPIQSTGNTGGDKTGATGTSPRHGSGQTSVSSQTFSGNISSLIPSSAPL